VRLALLVPLLAVALAGCGGGHRTGSRTQLTMVALNASVGRAVFHLDCGPTGGDLPAAARACATLARRPQLVTTPKPFTCAGGTFSWWDVTISGRLRGRPLRRAFSTCWTPQMATLGRLGLSWQVLQKHLVPRRRGTVLPGTSRTFPAGDLRAADLVTCDVLGHHLEAGVPDTTGPDAEETVGFGGANVVSVFLSVTHNRDGSVTARCGKGTG
jgi:hypothetical protein